MLEEKPLAEGGRSMIMIPDKRVAEVISRLTGVPVDQLQEGIPLSLPFHDSGDSLDTIDLIIELEEEFDKETVQWALRYAEALAARSSRSRPGRRVLGPKLDDPDPLWDRDLDS